MSDIKIFEVGSDWVAAKNWKDAIREVHRITGIEKRELIDDGAIELSDKQLDEFIFYDDLSCTETSPQRSFREQLDNMIKEKVDFPEMFASRDW